LIFIEPTRLFVVVSVTAFVWVNWHFQILPHQSPGVYGLHDNVVRIKVLYYTVF